MQIVKYFSFISYTFYHNNNIVISIDNLKYTILPHLLKNTILERLLDPHNNIFDFSHESINNFLTTMISIRR